MPTIQKMLWEYPNNKCEIEDWILTLPIHEQEEFVAAQKRQLQFRTEAMTQNKLLEINHDLGYVWKDEDEAIKNKPNDPVWEKYFTRWCDELGIKLTIIYENIP